MSYDRTRRFPALLLLACLLGSAGCASTRSDTGADPTSPNASRGADERDTANDPLEGFNRAMYTFNDKLDVYLLKPVAKGYRAVTPVPVRKGVSNFFSNLREPLVALNNALQGNFGAAASDLGRFVTNSTVGLLGLFDVGTRIGLEKHTEDFGQTLGVWGVAEGPYLVLPFFGPSGVRDGVGLIGDYAAHPVTYLEDESIAWTLFALDVIDTRARYLDASDILEQAAGDDPYIFVREAYRQRRRHLIRGDAEPAPVDPSIFEEDPPAATPAPPPRD